MANTPDVTGAVEDAVPSRPLCWVQPSENLFTHCVATDTVMMEFEIIVGGHFVECFAEIQQNAICLVPICLVPTVHSHS